jgi:hypothetical protein
MNDELILKKFRRAVCLQESFWSACFDIEKLYAVPGDIFQFIFRIAPRYLNDKINEREVEIVLSEWREQSVYGDVIEDKSIEQSNRQTIEAPISSCLFAKIQNAISLRNEFLRAAESLTESLDRSLEHTLEAIDEFTTFVDAGMELDEADLQSLREDSGVPTRVRSCLKSRPRMLQ